MFFWVVVAGDRRGAGAPRARPTSPTTGRPGRHLRHLARRPVVVRGHPLRGPRRASWHRPPALPAADARPGDGHRRPGAHGGAGRSAGCSGPSSRWPAAATRRTSGSACTTPARSASGSRCRIFQAVEDFAVFCVLLLVERRLSHWPDGSARSGFPSGTVIGVGMVLWGIERFLDEHLWLGEDGHLGLAPRPGAPASRWPSAASCCWSSPGGAGIAGWPRGAAGHQRG